MRSAFIGLSLLVLAGCASEKPAPVSLVPTSFVELDGWSATDHDAAYAAYKRSCERLIKQPTERPMGGVPDTGTIGDWRLSCWKALNENNSAPSAKMFFETEFLPYQLIGDGDPQGLFTGYFEPLLYGSRTPDERYRFPLRNRPADLVRVNLGAFDPELDGRLLRGRIDGSTIVPFPDRTAIDEGALSQTDLEFVWVDDEIDKFFLQIQGSGLVELDDGSVMRVGYAEQNGRPYRAIGRDLIEMGELTRETVSMQSIRAWLEDHPDQATSLMHRNPSYIFFQELDLPEDAPGPLGSMSVSLEPGYSIAVDRKFVPLGAPVWLDASAPFPDGERPLQRLLIAQDVGGAIKGVVRGDVFWGSGETAEFVAGHMKSQGTMYILLPKHLAPTS